MTGVTSKNGFPIGSLLPDKAYWAVKLNDDSWLCEMDEVDAHMDKWVTVPSSTGVYTPIDLVSRKRPLDWTLDLISTGDWAKVVELWLFCPPTYASPAGNTARLPIVPSGTAFQLKVGTVDSTLVLSHRRCLAQIIGRVTDPETGACECYVYDYEVGSLLVFPDEHGQLGPWKTHIGIGDNPGMGTWRPNIPGKPSIAPIGRLSPDVLGLRLPTYRYAHQSADCGCGGGE